MVRNVRTLVLVIAVVGCGSYGPQPTAVEEYEYLPGLRPTASVLAYGAAAGDSVNVQFENPGAVLYSFSPCLRRVERLVSGLWVDEIGSGVDCAQSLVVVPAGGSTVRRFDVPPTAPAGYYRYRFPMAAPTGAALSVVTGQFRVW